MTPTSEDKLAASVFATGLMLGFVRREDVVRWATLAAEARTSFSQSRRDGRSRKLRTEKSLAGGFQMYLAKPVESAELISMVASLSKQPM